MSLVVGIEEPIGENGNLSVTVGDGLKPFSRRMGRGGRLTVVAKEERDWMTIESLAKAVVPFEAASRVVDAWVGSRLQLTTTAALLMGMRRKKAGWEVESEALDDDQTIHVGLTRNFERHWLEVLRQGGGVAVHDENLSLRDVWNFRPDLRQLARRGASPSYELIEWVIERNAAISYRVRDELGRFGLVMVGALNLSADTLQAQDISIIHRGEDAGLVLRQGFGSSLP